MLDRICCRYVVLAVLAASFATACIDNDQNTGARDGAPADAPASALDAVARLDAPASTQDAASTADAGPVIVDAGAVSVDAACEPPQQTPPKGKHEWGGKACAQCHAKSFTVSGTIYTDKVGTAPLVGATIVVYEKNKTFKVVSDKYGNFWLRDKVTYPVTVAASACPDHTPMVATVKSPGDCNSCHTSEKRIHLP